MEKELAAVVELSCGTARGRTLTSILQDGTSTPGCNTYVPAVYQLMGPAAAHRHTKLPALVDGARAAMHEGSFAGPLEGDQAGSAMFWPTAYHSRVLSAGMILGR